MIERPYYLNQLLRAKDTDFIKIITGIRRSGKSTLLEMLKKHLLTQGIPENHVIHISYEQIPWFPLEKAETLYAYIKEHITEPAHRYYLLIDEVQELEEWAKVINGLKATFPLDIYITGSNSRLFSGEYLTYITGRYIEIKVYPLSLSEFMTFRGYDESNVAKHSMSISPLVLSQPQQSRKTPNLQKSSTAASSTPSLHETSSSAAASAMKASSSKPPNSSWRISEVLSP